MRMGSIGDNVVDRYEATNMMYPGGGAANVAVHAGRAGWRTDYIGVVGSDDAGRLIAQSLRDEGVGTDLVHWVDEPNASTDVDIDAQGNRRFVRWTQPATPLVISPTSREALREMRWLYTNYSSQSEHLVPEIARIAPLAFDFSYKGEDYAEDLLPHITIAAFSRDGIGDTDAVEMIRRVQAKGPRTVIVTRGARGAVVAVGENVHFQPAQRTAVVDTLGAGDAFLARFVCGMEQGETIETAARAAAAAAADVCGHHGAFGHGAPLNDRMTEDDQHVT